MIDRDSEDLVRTVIRDTWRVDDPASARELIAPRLRFELAYGATTAAALTEARHRADELVQALPGTLLVRLVDWESQPSPPGLEWRPHLDDRNSDEVPRRIHTAVVAGDRSGVQRVLHAALDGQREWDLWLMAVHGPDVLLLRPYDDRGADLVANADALLTAFRERFAAWCISG